MAAMLSGRVAGSDLHREAANRLAAFDQRYTPGREAIVDVLVEAARPMTVPEILAAAERDAVTPSSLYRNLAVLADAQVVHRLPGSDEFARYELAEELAGHHHHLSCTECGAVVDVEASPRVERALAAATRLAAEENGFEITGHRIDLVGRCRDCR
jgi:Fur family ferric uptake transcriptional regulator